MGKNFCKIEHKWCKFCQHHKCIWNDEKKKSLNEIHRCPKRESVLTIRLKDILQIVKIYDVLKAIEKWYPSEVSKPLNMEGYIKVFFKLRDEIRAKKSDWFINVEEYDDYEFRDTEDHKDVIRDENGEMVKFPIKCLDVTSKRLTDKYGFASSLVAWDEWLGMNIEQSCLDKMSNEDIVAGCLYEMTWWGFDQNAPTDGAKKIQYSIEECKQNLSKK